MSRLSGASFLLNCKDMLRQAGFLLLLFVFTLCSALFFAARISSAQTGSVWFNADQAASLSGIRPVLRVLFCGNTHGDLFPCPS